MNPRQQHMQQNSVSPLSSLSLNGAVKNWPIIKLLILKDWALMKKSLAAYMAGGVLVIGMMGMATPMMFNIGAVLMITLMIVIGARSAVELVVNEKKDQTLAFMMSLPITAQDYALAKLCSNLALYLVPWLLLVLGMLLVIVSTPIYNGVIPLVVLVLLAALFVGWSLNRDPVYKPDAMVGQPIPETVLPRLATGDGPPE
ncbi:MAG: ABC-2 transporter permease, partial [Rheinheimera sp.]